MRTLRKMMQLPALMLALTGCLLLAQSASAEMRVVATTPSLGMLANAVGGEHVNVRVLAGGSGRALPGCTSQLYGRHAPR